MSDKSESAAISWRGIAGDGLPSFGWVNAKVLCPECDGWRGTVCPHGCGVHLESTQVEDDQDYRERMKAQAEERETFRAEMRARRSASSRDHATSSRTEED